MPTLAIVIFLRYPKEYGLFVYCIYLLENAFYQQKVIIAIDWGWIKGTYNIGKRSVWQGDNWTPRRD